MGILAFIVTTLARHTFLTTVCAVVLLLLYEILSYKLNGNWQGQRRSVDLRPWIFVGACLALNFSLGNWLADTLIYNNGFIGRATVVGQHPTGVYNNQEQPIERFEMLISTQDGRTVESGFDADESVVYPYRLSPDLPQVSEVFTVRYLPRAPHAFVILTNDGSPSATRIRCRPFLEAASAAESKHAFAPSDPAYRRRYHDAVQAVLLSNCPLDSNEVQSLAKYRVSRASRTVPHELMWVRSPQAEPSANGIHLAI